MKTGESKEKWQEVVDAWRASGLSKADFCRRQKIIISMFYYWCKKLESGDDRKHLKTRSQPKQKRKPEAKGKSAFREKAIDDKPAFVEISIPKSDSASHVTGQVFRITTSYGAVMEIPI